MRIQTWRLGAALIVVILIVGLFTPGPVMTAEFRNAFDIELRRFMGTWYELARTPNSFEDNRPHRHGERFSPCYNARATYTLASSEKVRIVNSCLRRSKEGTVIEDSIKGMALVAGAGGRILKVAFGSGMARALQRLFTRGGGGYWIYCLGPINDSGLYDWAVVSGPKRNFVFVLAREQAVPDSVKEKILACARSEGLPVDRLLYRQE